MYAARHAREHPDRPAVIMASTGETITYAEYERRCNRAAHLMRDAGLGPGDHISVLMENHPRMLDIEGAAERIGVYFTLVNAYLAPDEVAYIVNNSRSRLFFTSVAKRDVAEQAVLACPALERCFMVGLERPRPVGGSPTRRPPRPGPLTRYRMNGSGPPCCTRPGRPASRRVSCDRFRTWPPTPPFQVRSCSSSCSASGRG